MAFDQTLKKYVAWIRRNRKRFGERCNTHFRGCVVCDWWRLVEESESFEENLGTGTWKK